MHIVSILSTAPSIEVNHQQQNFTKCVLNDVSVYEIFKTVSRLDKARRMNSHMPFLLQFYDSIEQK